MGLEFCVENTTVALTEQYNPELNSIRSETSGACEFRAGGPRKMSVMGTHGWSSARLGFVVCGYLAFFCSEFVPPTEAGCRERDNPNCCTGRNNECFEYTKRKTVCYCDSYCQKTRDCCDDYQRVCQISGELLVLFRSLSLTSNNSRKYFSFDT